MVVLYRSKPLGLKQPPEGTCTSHPPRALLLRRQAYHGHPQQNNHARMYLVERCRVQGSAGANKSLLFFQGSSPTNFTCALSSSSLPPDTQRQRSQCSDTYPARNPLKGLPPCACSRRPSTLADQEEKTEYPHAPHPTVIIIRINYVSSVLPRRRFAHSLLNR